MSAHLVSDALRIVYVVDHLDREPHLAQARVLALLRHGGLLAAALVLHEADVLGDDRSQQLGDRRQVQAVGHEGVAGAGELHLPVATVARVVTTALLDLFFQQVSHGPSPPSRASDTPPGPDIPRRRAGATGAATAGCRAPWCCTWRCPWPGARRCRGTRQLRCRWARHSSPSPNWGTWTSSCRHLVVKVHHRQGLQVQRVGGELATPPLIIDRAHLDPLTGRQCDDLLAAP